MATENSCSSSENTESTGGSFSKAKYDDFLQVFLCDYLAKREGCRSLVEVKTKEGRNVLHFKNLVHISEIYCDFKERAGKSLSREPKRRIDNFKNILKMKEGNNWLKKFGGGMKGDKEYVKYEVKNQEWWQSLTTSYDVKHSGMVRENFFEVIDQRSAEQGSFSKAKYDDFLQAFLCDFLANHKECQNLFEVKTKVGRNVLHFKNLEGISKIYCDFKERAGKSLNRQPKKRIDNFKNILKMKEKYSCLKKISCGTIYGKEFVKYEVENQEWWESLTTSYQVVNHPYMVRENFTEAIDQRSTEPSTDEGVLSDIDQRSSEPSTDGDPRHDLSDLTFDKDPFGSLFELLNESESSSVNQLSNEPFPCDVNEVDVNELDMYLHTMCHVDDSDNGSRQLSHRTLRIVPDRCSIEGGCSFVIISNRVLPHGRHRVRFASYGICNAYGSDKYYLDGLDKIPAAMRRGTHAVTVRVSNETGLSIGECVFTYKDTLSNIFLAAKKEPKILGGSNPDNSFRRPTKKSSTVDEEKLLTICPDHCSVEDGLFLESKLSGDKLNKLLDMTGVVSGSGDLTARSSLDMRPTAVDVWTIVPEQCGTEGGVSFIIRAGHDLQEGTYYIDFSYYGRCRARGDGKRQLDGCDKIPAAKWSGTHSITVCVLDETGQKKGEVLFEYKNIKAARMRKLLVPKPKLGGPDSRKKSHRGKKNASSKSAEDTGCSKKFKSDAVDKSLLVYFCDEMAKSGDKHFFSALITLGIMGEVLENQGEYYKDFAATAREHGHNELAETIETFSRELPCDRHIETLTFRVLFDAVQKERSLGNSATANSSNSDHTANSYSSAYYGDCDSEDTRCSTNGSLIEFRDKPDAVSKNVYESPESWKWEKRSIIHREKFIKLIEYGKIHPEEIKEVNGVRVCCSNEFLIGRGCDGTRVYIGLGKDGVERAVKRLHSSLVGLAEQEKKVLNELNSTKSIYVVNYWFLDQQSDENFLFLILDLCEETLAEFVRRNSLHDLIKIAPDIIRQVLNGLADLHGDPYPILHRDLKPSNILRNVQGNWLLADFGISRILAEDISTHASTQRGTESWRAVESYPSSGTTDDGEVRYKKKSDVQVAGMVAFYIATKGEHPFGERLDRFRNLLYGNPVGLDGLKDPVLKDLLFWMLSHEPKDRPLAKEALKHPYLQPAEQQFEMLCKVGNQREIKTRDIKSDVVRNVNCDPKDWRNQIAPDVFNYLSTDSSRGRTFRYGSSWTDCLRFIRDANEHWYHRPRPRPEAFYLVGDPQEYFLNLFPNLLVKIHRIVRSCDWRERPDLKEYFM